MTNHMTAQSLQSEASRRKKGANNAAVQIIAILCGIIIIIPVLYCRSISFILIPTLVIFMLFQRKIVSGMTAGSEKG